MNQVAETDTATTVSSMHKAKIHRTKCHRRRAAVVGHPEENL